MNEIEKFAATLEAFEGRSHFLCGEKGWEEIADFILGWLEKQ